MARQLRVTIRLGNRLMNHGEHLSEALVRIADQVAEHGETDGPTKARSVFDLNGNRVGQWKIEEVDDGSDDS